MLSDQLGLLHAIHCAWANKPDGMARSYTVLGQTAGLDSKMLLHLFTSWLPDGMGNRAFILVTYYISVKLQSSPRSRCVTQSASQHLQHSSSWRTLLHADAYVSCFNAFMLMNKEAAYWRLCQLHHHAFCLCIHVHGCTLGCYSMCVVAERGASLTEQTVYFCAPVLYLGTST